MLGAFERKIVGNKYADFHDPSSIILVRGNSISLYLSSFYCCAFFNRGFLFFYFFFFLPFVSVREAYVLSSIEPLVCIFDCMRFILIYVFISIDNCRQVRTLFSWAP